MTLGNSLAQKHTDVVTIDMSWSLQAAAALMTHHHVAALVVTDCGKPVGLISERDLVNALADTGSRVAGISIRDVITGPIPAAAAGESIMHAIALMTERRVRHLPIFDGNKVIALVTMADLIKCRLQEIESQVTAWHLVLSPDRAPDAPNEPSCLLHRRQAPEVPAPFKL